MKERQTVKQNQTWDFYKCYGLQQDLGTKTENLKKKTLQNAS